MAERPPPRRLDAELRYTPATASKRLLIIHNPVAGRRRQDYLNAVIAALRRQGCELLIRQTGAPGEGERLLRDHPDRFDRIVAAGGDGTLNEVLNGTRGRACRLGLIPLGTSNVLCRELALPTQPDRLAQVLAGDSEVVLHPALANGRRFLLMCGIGFDAWVVNGVDLDLKRRLGKGAYLLTMARMVGRYGRQRYRVRSNDQQWQVGSLIISHARHYAGPFVLDPEASLFAPHLNLVMLERHTRLGLLSYLLALPTGRSSRLPGVRRALGSHIHVEGAVGEPIQLDGDPHGCLPVTITLDPEPVRIAVDATHPHSHTDQHWMQAI